MSDNIRHFELQAYDETKTTLLDRFVLDLVTSPSGLGFYQEISTIDTKTISYIVERALKKQDIKITVEFEEPNSYQKVNSLRSWIAKNMLNNIALSYNDTFTERLIDVYIKDFQLTEIVTNYNSIPLVLTPLSPFYKKGYQKAIISKLGTAKQYPYSYEYSYGGASLINNELDNTFFTSIPLLITIYGKATNPIVKLLDENGIEYSQISFPNLVVEEGETLTIDAINSQILFKDTVSTQDYYNKIDKKHDTFLFAQSGKTIIDANFLTTDSGYIEIIYIQYTI